MSFTCALQGQQTTVANSCKHELGSHPWLLPARSATWWNIPAGIDFTSSVVALKHSSEKFVWIFILLWVNSFASLKVFGAASYCSENLLPKRYYRLIFFYYRILSVIHIKLLSIRYEKGLVLSWEVCLQIFGSKYQPSHFSLHIESEFALPP